MHFRLMTDADIDQVIRCERQAYSHPWSEGVFADCIAGPSECWVVIDADNLIGYLVTTSAANEGHILNICIGVEWQGEGRGHSLLSFALSRFLELQVRTVFLEVRESNRRAITLYKYYGFEVIGRRKKYYPDQEDAMVMSKHLVMDVCV